MKTLRLSKKFFAAFLMMFVLVFVAPTVLPDVPTVIKAQAKTTVKLNTTSVVIRPGKTKTLKITGTKKKVTWSSSNKKVATVSSKGKITAKKYGVTTITAKVGSKKYKCKVKVIYLDGDWYTGGENRQETYHLVVNGNKVVFRGGGEQIKCSGTITQLSNTKFRVKTTSCKMWINGRYVTKNMKLRIDITLHPDAWADVWEFDYKVTITSGKNYLGKTKGTMFPNGDAVGY
ncbi:MAG: Ig-like domain-containing protein [Eubacteriales bacterium]|nr:Ig-like domain-containing protein [Eubacteriales bacterium]